MRMWKYVLVYVTPAIVAFSLLSKGFWTYSAVLLLFGLLPLLELFMKGSKENLTAEDEQKELSNLGYDLLLYSLVPIQYGLLALLLFQISQEDVSWFSRLGMMLSFGMSCGILGINAAHELGHRTTWYEQFMSKMLLLTSLYMHFFIEHNRGHHKNVATDDDPASSRYGETIYAFLVRTISGSWLSAWQLEQERLTRIGHPVWSWRNEMLRFQLIQVAFILFIYVVFGGMALLCFGGSAFVGCLLLETVNYIEHYGLRRKKEGNRYVRTLPIHSWNSNHPIGRLLLFELSRHSDHHFIATRKYQVLRHFDESPQMPTGYPGMMLLSLVPPLWFRVMHREIEKVRQKHDV